MYSLKSSFFNVLGVYFAFAVKTQKESIFAFLGTPDIPDGILDSE